MKEKVVVRFAPSPTGPLHIGGVRTALYNYLFAKKHQGRCILRIEDTDRTRFVPGAEQYIIDSLKWIGVDFTEGVSYGGDAGPYRQSERKDLYRQYADQLLESGNAYLAFDTSEELEAMRERLKASGSQSLHYNYITRTTMRNSLTLPEEEVKTLLDAGTPYVIRMKMPRKEEIRFQDLVRNWVVFHSSQLDDKILLKSDGMPTYHLANVVDDHLMEITHVIRGEEWLSSTPLHVMLYRSLGWEATMPKFVHLPLILNPNGKGKMSKRQGDKLGFSVFPTQWQDPETGNTSSGYREDGYLAEALFNFLALQGWNPGDDEEIMSHDRLIERFSLARINSSATNFDIDKLRWFNENYIRQSSPETLLPLVKADFVRRGVEVPTDEQLAGIVRLLIERVKLIPDFYEQSTYIFAAPTEYNNKARKKAWKGAVVSILNELSAGFEALASWEQEAIHQSFQSFIEAKELGIGKVMAPLRLALTGQASGPGIFEIATLLGKAETLSRIQQAITVLGDPEAQT